jgi:hypothetical protein
MNKIIICIGNGRDGTYSLKENLKNICKINNSSIPVYHEKFAENIYNTFHFNYKNKKKINTFFLSIANNFNLGEVHVSNGYTLILDKLINRFTSSIKIIRIKRDKKDWIPAFKKNIFNYPLKHGNYTNLKKAQIYRMAAWHFEEMSKIEWNKMSINKKLNWYYDKNDDLVKRNNILNKKNYLQINTKSLDDLVTIKAITKFINPKWKCPSYVLKTNVSKIDYATLNNYEKKVMGTFYSSFDYKYAANNPVYGALFFFEKVLDGYKNRKKYSHSYVKKNELNSFLEKYKFLLKKFNQ